MRRTIFLLLLLLICGMISADIFIYIAGLEEIVLKKELGSKIIILSPFVQNEKGTHKEAFEKFVSLGFERVRVDGSIYRISEVPPLEKNKKHFIDVVVDRLILKEDSQSRLY